MQNGISSHNSRSVNSVDTVVECNTTWLIAHSKALLIQVLSIEFVWGISLQIMLCSSIQTTDTKYRNYFREWTMVTYVLSIRWTPLWKAIPRELFRRPWHCSSRFWAMNLSPESFSSSCWAARHKLIKTIFRTYYNTCTFIFLKTEAMSEHYWMVEHFRSKTDVQLTCFISTRVFFLFFVPRNSTYWIQQCKWIMQRTYQSRLFFILSFFKTCSNTVQKEMLNAKNQSSWKWMLCSDLSFGSWSLSLWINNPWRRHFDSDRLSKCIIVLRYTFIIWYFVQHAKNPTLHYHKN